MRSESRPVVFIFAHPDDEFACSMWMRRLVRDGVPVACAYLTDGGFAGQPTERRERESLRALARLGVGPAAVRFLGRENRIGDGQLPMRLDIAWTALLEWVGSLGPIDRLVVPAWEGGHQDHDACHLLGLALARRLQREVDQIPLYNGQGLPGPFFRVLHPLPANGPVSGYRAAWPERLEAVRLCLSYTSQWKTWVGLLPFFMLRMLSSGLFPRQPVDPRRISQRPHDGAPLYERRGFMTYDAFRHEADRFMTLNAG